MLSAFSVTCDIILDNAEQRQLFLEWILPEMSRFFSGFFLIKSQSEWGRKCSNIKAVFKISLFKEKKQSSSLANAEII